MNSSSDTSEDLLLRLIRLGVRVRAECGQLRLRPGGASLDRELVDEVRAERDALIRRVGASKFACLSPAQERMWFLSQFGGGEAYNLPGLARIEGPLDLVALEESFAILVERHESLRTTFPAIAGVPLQEIHADARFPFQIHEVQDESAALGLARRLVNQPLDLARPPLFLVDVARWSSDHCLVLARMHHIASDGWSLRVMLEELASAYAKLSRGLDVVWEPLSLQYAGYASWSRARDAAATEDGGRQAALRFWEETLSGIEDLDLPTDYPRPELLGNRGDVVLHRIAPEANESIRSSARSRKLAPLSIWLAAVSLVLSRRSRNPDIGLGIPVTSRDRPELSAVVGLFANTLVIRPSPRPGVATASDYLSAVHEAFAAAMEHRDVPIEEILATLRPSRRLDRTPLFQVLVNYAAEAPATIALGDCLLTPLMPEGDSAKFEWTFSATEQADGAALLAVEFSTDLYRRETAARLASEVASAALALVTGLDCPLERLNLVPTPDLELLKQWGHTPPLPLTAPTVHAGLERSAAVRPDDTALVDRGRSWTYRALLDASGAVAARLNTLGVNHGDLIAVCIPRSARLVVAIHGILNAGAAYWPVGIDEAPARLGSILGPPVRAMLCDATTPEDLIAAAEAAGCRVLQLNDLESVGHAGHAPLPLSSGPDRLPDGVAYVMSTSGTSGRPKGVMIGHESVSNHSIAVINAFELRPGDRVAQLSTPAFDIFVEEVFPTLRAGATLVILPDSIRLDPRKIAEATRAERITVLDLPTSLFHLLAEDDQASGGLFDGLRLIVVGGERLDGTLAGRFLDRRPAVTLLNTYGPTEATVIATSHRVTRGASVPDIPIGRPIPGVEVVLLDREGRPSPIGAVGEIHLGGLGKMKGYLNDHEATAAALVPHPWHPGEQLYRTGDLGVWSEDGVLRFLGRSDDQVKIRGFRVEPAEVEAALAADADVGQAAVVPVGEPGGRRLVAFVTPNGSRRIDPETIRRRLILRIPDYMRPAEVRVLDCLPVVGGKVDRKALASLAARSPSRPMSKPAGREGAPPDEAFLGLWREILGRADAGPDDDFFESGGHSLLAVRLVRHIEERLGVSIPVADVFRYPTLRQLAARIGTGGSVAGSAQARPRAALLRHSVATFLLPGLPGIGGYYHELAGCLPTEGEILAVSLPGYDGDRPATTLRDMATHWLDAVESVAANRSVRFLAHSYAGNILHEMLRIRDPGRFRLDAIYLLDAMPHRRMSQLDGDLLTSWTEAFGLELIPEARAVVEAALTVRALGETTKLDLEPTLIVASESRAWLDPAAWAEHFRSVRVVETPGDHLSIVRRPDCLRWIERTSLLQSGARP